MFGSSGNDKFIRVLAGKFHCIPNHIPPQTARGRNDHCVILVKLHFLKAIGTWILFVNFFQRNTLLIPDSEAVARAMDEAVGLLKDPVRLAELSRNIEALAIPDSAERIVNEIEKQLPQSK